jgi:RHS repeat-associated protein
VTENGATKNRVFDGTALVVDGDTRITRAPNGTVLSEAFETIEGKGQNATTVTVSRDVLADVLNSAVAVAEDGIIDADLVFFTDFGEELFTPERATVTGFTGRTDAAGLVEFETRAYDPVTRVWVQEDTYPGTVTRASSMNRYTYVEGAPETYVDAFGMYRAASAVAAQQLSAKDYADFMTQFAQLAIIGWFDENAQMFSDWWPKGRTGNNLAPEVDEDWPEWWDPAWSDQPFENFLTDQQIQALDSASDEEQLGYATKWALTVVTREAYLAEYPDRSGFIDAAAHSYMANEYVTGASDPFGTDIWIFHYRSHQGAHATATRQAPALGADLALKSVEQTVKLLGSGARFGGGMSKVPSSGWSRSGFTLADVLMGGFDLGTTDDFYFDFGEAAREEM